MGRDHDRDEPPAALERLLRVVDARIDEQLDVALHQFIGFGEFFGLIGHAETLTEAGGPMTSCTDVAASVEACELWRS